MKVGYFDHAPTRSVEVYTQHVVRELTPLGVEMIPFRLGDSLPPEADVYWDPRLTGTTLPTERFRQTTKPCVATFHGAPSLSLWPWEYFESVKGIRKRLRLIVLQWARWRRSKGWGTTLITVSNYTKGEIARKLGVDKGRIVPIYHGIDHEIFRPAELDMGQAPYFVHVSYGSPKKNIARMVAAYRQLPQQNRPKLILVMPGSTYEASDDGIEIVRTSMSHSELATLYQNAIGYLMPSLWESFGFPIIEAMACGCPVITSDVTACPETAGDAALLVNPRSVSALAQAMQRLSDDLTLRTQLRQKGLARAQQFSWRKCAEQHLQLFEALHEKRSIL